MIRRKTPALYRRGARGHAPAHEQHQETPRAVKPHQAAARPATVGASILDFDAHGIRRDDIDECALKVCDTLANAGYHGYVVGGAVRDLLLGHAPKDFDVATDATPEEVKRLFRRSRIIGRRFKIVHVMCGRETIEVTTFRANGPGDPDEDDERPTDEHGRLLSDNVFGSMDDDAARRDFTVNALYYDPEREEVHDFFGGVADCRAHTLRMIGDPETRYREDPVRMLRAARFAAKLGFELEPATREPVARLEPLLANIPRARIFDEMMKMLLSGHSLAGVHQLRTEGLHRGTLPFLDTLFADPESERFITAALQATDDRLNNDRSVSPAYLFAALLWPQVNQRWKTIQSHGEKPLPALNFAMDDVLDEQRVALSIPRRHDGTMKEIWSLQPRFEQRGGQRPFRLMEHPRFRAAYDFLLLRCESGEVEEELGVWWTRFQDAGDHERGDMLIADGLPKQRKRRKRKKPAGESNADDASEASDAGEASDAARASRDDDYYRGDS